VRHQIMGDHGDTDRRVPIKHTMSHKKYWYQMSLY